VAAGRVEFLIDRTPTASLRGADDNHFGFSGLQLGKTRAAHFLTVLNPGPVSSWRHWDL